MQFALFINIQDYKLSQFQIISKSTILFLLLLKQIMTASADKVQFLLESSLEQTLPLVKKGIFTEQQLRQIMLERQKHENKLYSSTYKLSHFLKAVQFQYDLERQRISKIKNQEQQNVNPLFKKQGKTDFSIVKRIIKLWDRTMHKYRYRTYLWKQYLSFCIALKSKKHFYKALTNALRFLPFELQLWKTGVRYEVQVGRNLWKARKLFHKGLKLIPAGDKNIQLTKQLIKFELQFVQTLQSRQRIIQGQNQEDQNDMKFIMGDNHEENQDSQSNNQGQLIAGNNNGQILKLREYHEVLFVALVDSINKNYRSKTYFNSRPNMSVQQKYQGVCDLYLKFLSQVDQRQQNELLSHILKATIRKVQVYRTEGLKLEYKEQQDNQMQAQQDAPQDEQRNVLVQQVPQHCLLIQEQKGTIQQQSLRELSKQERYSHQIMESYRQNSSFDDKLFGKGIRQFCLKPHLLNTFLEPILQHLLTEALQVLRRNEWLRIPLKSMQRVLQKLNQQGQANSANYLPYFTKQFQKINPFQYMTHIQLLRQVIIFNKLKGKVEQNNKLYRSLLVNCKQNVEFVQRAKLLFVQ